MKIGRLKVTASRWPWQGYGWFPHKQPWSHGRAPLNASGARFGGGWTYKFGIAIGGSDIILDLIFGSVRIKIDGKSGPAPKEG